MVTRGHMVQDILTKKQQTYILQNLYSLDEMDQKSFLFV